MSPRQLAAYAHFAGARRSRHAAETLALHATAARGEARAIRKQIKDLTKE